MSNAELAATRPSGAVDLTEQFVEEFQRLEEELRKAQQALVETKGKTPPPSPDTEFATERQVQELQQRVVALHAEKTMAEQELKIVRRQLGATEEERDGLRREGSRNPPFGTAQQSASELASVRREKEQLQRTLNEYRERCAEQQQEISYLKGENRDYFQQNNKLQQEVESLRNGWQSSKGG